MEKKRNKKESYIYYYIYIFTIFIYEKKKLPKKSVFDMLSLYLSVSIYI